MGSMRGGVAEDKGADSDDEYTLTGYGEMSTDDQFMLPPSPTQTIKYRYRAYRPKLARLGKKYRNAANGRTPLKTKSSAYHPSVSHSIYTLTASRAAVADRNGAGNTGLLVHLGSVPLRSVSEARLPGPHAEVPRLR